MPQQRGPGWLSSGAHSFRLVGGLTALALLVVLTAVACGGKSSKSNAVVATVPTALVDHAGLAAADTPVATVTAPPQPTAVAPVQSLTSIGSGDRLIVSKFNINAPLAYSPVGVDGVMPDPADPDVVNYYDFSSLPGLGGAPGKGGNSVFAGHVDSGHKPCDNGKTPPPCEAVFWDVRSLATGDEVDLVVGGTTYKYRVTSRYSVTPTDDWNKIVAATQNETVTLITCTGEFTGGEYTNRLVVTAVRI